MRTAFRRAALLSCSMTLPYDCMITTTASITAINTSTTLAVWLHDPAGVLLRITVRFIYTLSSTTMTAGSTRISAFRMRLATVALLCTMPFHGISLIASAYVCREGKSNPKQRLRRQTRRVVNIERSPDTSCNTLPGTSHCHHTRHV